MTILQDTDWFLTSRTGIHTKSQISELLNYIKANLGTTDIEVADIAARDALTANEVSVSDRVKVVDATADATVNTGWAIYIYYGPGTWSKAAEQESMDVVVNPSNLNYVAGSTSGTVTNSNGTGFTIPAADAIGQAGLLIPLDKSKLDNITVTANINLDTIAADSHKAVTAGGTSTDNPIVVGGTSGQQLTFNIEALTELT